MKLNLQLLTLAALIMLASISGVLAQNTCGSAEWFDDYQFDGQYMTANFSTVGVPNDNATSGAPFCGTSVGTGGQKWFRFSLNSPEPIMVTLSTDHFITNFDTKIHVFVGFCGYLACIAGDDDSGTGTTSTVTFEALPGQVYRVRVGGYNGAEGTTNVQMFAGSPGCTDPAAQNYHLSYTWDNGSCCYNGYATLHITNNGGQPFENTASILVDNQNYLEIHPNYTMSACTPQSCNFQLEFYDSNGGSWGGDTYTLEINGRSFTGPIPSPDPWGYSTVDIPVCGCTDPMAGNYSYQAIYDDGSCCYNGTLSLSADAPASAEAYFYGVDA
ncbi:MAG: hypothetical protein JNM00_07725, partial [Flavobacteriales bacterium]|nr:hypothetical protein [Flavobacteriales bacterium]